MRVDDVVDSAPRLSGITVAEQGSRESGRFDMLASEGAVDLYTELIKLKELKETSVITEEESRFQKRRILEKR